MRRRRGGEPFQGGGGGGGFAALPAAGADEDGGDGPVRWFAFWRLWFRAGAGPENPLFSAVTTQSHRGLAALATADFKEEEPASRGRPYGMTFLPLTSPESLEGRRIGDGDVILPDRRLASKRSQVQLRWAPGRNVLEM
jgi:hypothetical protein